VLGWSKTGLGGSRMGLGGSRAWVGGSRTALRGSRAVVLNVWVATQTWVAMGSRMGREGTPSEKCLFAQKPGKIQPFYGILIL
jgi:hypothetical protein